MRVEECTADIDLSSTARKATSIKVANLENMYGFDCRIIEGLVCEAIAFRII